MNEMRQDETTELLTWLLRTSFSNMMVTENGDQDVVTDPSARLPRPTRHPAICSIVPSNLLWRSKFPLTTESNNPSIPMFLSIQTSTKLSQNTKYQPSQSNLATLNLLSTLTALSADPDAPNEG
ncbi:hypothetical protein BDQ94DRAFT_140354 [Aspergillus welwitschiae]|uniref:Uncharacterized protein n=1 Tax=Aspergillus welwitschiae TaxID=1341132 RepID=A0A3F3Q7H5_9EURO|nr:hypothetical protein BDQ94DRAFT_140354 [Aspergillus welwitschiae]RDH35184.1 hypothetical protein BDQ94DRAFT_140354 [Aspergillus welwitschiae]